jgi:hypothetical protein
LVPGLPIEASLTHSHSMGTKSRDSLYGSSVRHSAERAAKARKGDTVNLAAGLQALAAPNGILLSQLTHRLVQALVEATFAGEHVIKGKSEPQGVYQLTGIRPGVARFDAAVSRGLSVFVGRERELEVLERALAAARRARHEIDVVAEPGAGKSRLLYEFRRRVGKAGAIQLSGSCSPDGQQTPFLPFIEVVRSAFRLLHS